MEVNSCTSSCYANFETTVFVVDLLIWRDFIMLMTVLRSIFLNDFAKNKISLSPLKMFRIVTFSFGGNNLLDFKRGYRNNINSNYICKNFRKSVKHYFY